MDRLYVLVHFVLLQLNTRDWVIYKEQKFISSQLWRLKSTTEALASGEAFLLCYLTAGRQSECQGAAPGPGKGSARQESRASWPESLPLGLSSYSAGLEITFPVHGRWESHSNHAPSDLVC